ncbi:MAG TPA: 2-oxoacid:acceptor oxidoreductase subunit alpha [Anaerolineaceae bacterium]|nr:2-oxoacid:acceptor oxidoreductase subunit alpha [Anaerolineaceae bacterium]
MSLPQVDLETGTRSKRDPIVNNFSISISTVNGSGSATANSTILRALFKMGIPVNGKNIFPSNIQGLPTWYNIRLSKEGYLARLDNNDIVIAMNPTTFAREQQSIISGGVLFYADDIKFTIGRDDIISYAMPVKKLTKEANVPANLREYIANMVYVGVLAEMLGIDLDAIYQSLDLHFKGKKVPVDSNFEVVKSAAKWASENLVKKDIYRVEKMNGTSGCIMADGNTAAALGAIYGGVQFAAWYPITPASSLAEELIQYLPTLRKDPLTGKTTYAVVQAEDEIAAIGMATGAGWGGLRSMTSTSGPGLSLMAEYLGMAYFAEIPVVVWDVQRVGPSTGLPTRTSQADLTFVNFVGHGDTQYIILLPGSVKECFEFGWRAFDIAERIQTPVLVLSDLDLGMNQWMSDKFEYPEVSMDRGKILWEDDMDKLLERLKGAEWGRYLDIDGDGIPYRTVVGNRHPKSVYFTRGTGHDEYGHYSEDPEVWERILNRIRAKFTTAKQYLPKPIIRKNDGAKFGIIAYGSVDPAVEEARDLLAKAGILTDYMRVRSIPFAPEVGEFIKEHSKNYVVEINRDGQLKQLLTLETPDYATHLIQTSHIDGLPLTARWVEEQILAHEG